MLALLLALASVVVTAGPTTAQTYRFFAPDGTLHITNKPRDLRDQPTGVTAPWELDPGAVPYGREITQAAEQYGVPAKLVAAVIQAESDFNPRAVSGKGARGLMQLMPRTASFLGVWDSFHPWENIDGGVRHLRGLMERFGNDLPLALAAYNAGEQAVAWYRDIPPYPETRRYVMRVLRLFRAPTIAGISSRPVSDPAAEMEHVPGAIYRLTEPDGTIIYTNIPSRARPGGNPCPSDCSR